jgi:hypothetical protein
MTDWTWLWSAFAVAMAAPLAGAADALDAPRTPSPAARTTAIKIARI